MRPDEDGTGAPPPPPEPPVPRAEVCKRLKVFLYDLQAEQKGRSVKITSRVREAGHALADGLDSADVQMTALLHDDSRGFDADELAEKMAALLPDTIPAENFGRFLAKAHVGPPEKEKKPGLVERGRQAVKKGIDQLGETPPGDGSPTDHAQPPDAQQSLGGVRPDDHFTPEPPIPVGGGSPPPPPPPRGE